MIIIAGAFAFLRTREGHVPADLSPGNIYTGSKDPAHQESLKEDSKDMETASGTEESAKVDNFTFYKILNSKEDDITPLKVEPSKSLPEREPYKESQRDEKMEQINREIVKKIETKEKEGIIYTVQIGALSQEKAANELTGNLRANGFAPYIVKENNSAGIPVYKVRVGKFLSMVDAQDVAAVLKREGYAIYVLKISVTE